MRIATACLRVERRTVTVNPPSECDKRMRRDGIAMKPPAGTGERAWWLEEILARHSNKSAAEVRVDIDREAEGLRVVGRKGAEPGASIADGSQGTGLGLAIAKGIMEAHGGSIDAESPAGDGRGARFVLVFPREETPA